MAIIVNPAAIADAGETGILPEAIDRAARQEMASLITLTLSRLVSSGRFHRDTNPDEAAATNISLLFGEVPMRPVRERGAGRLSNQIENSGPS